MQFSRRLNAPGRGNPIKIISIKVIKTPLSVILLMAAKFLCGGRVLGHEFGKRGFIVDAIHHEYNGNCKRDNHGR